MAQKYGDWTIEKSIDEGGQAQIFLAKNSDNEFGVIKRLKNIKRKERFVTEITAIKNDPKGLFPKIYSYDLDAEKPYFVMEYFPNGCLKQETINSWSLEKKSKFFVYLMLAISWANLQGVVHRVLKPENILLDQNFNPKVSDFGICFIDEDGNRNTHTQEATGSFRFMAPELEDGRSDLVGNHSDVYSLGKIAYWLFSDGNIYNRERHRDENFDLSKKIDEHWVHYFNDFLDKATCHDITNRIKDCPTLIVEFGKVEKSIRNSSRYLDLNINQECMFCRNGSYKTIVNSLDLSGSSAGHVRNFGFNPVGQSQWLIMACDNCGNIQSFRKDQCPQWGWK